MDPTSPDACPFCRGGGRIWHSALERALWPNGLLCVECDGTGDRGGMMLLRAYRHGLETMRGAIESGTFEVPVVGLSHIRAVVGRSVISEQMRDAQMRLEYARRALEDLSPEQRARLGAEFVVEHQLGD